jgi:transposase
MSRQEAVEARRAEFNRLREEGLGVVDAAARVGVSFATGQRYERWRTGARAPDLAAQRDWMYGSGDR